MKPGHIQVFDGLRMTTKHMNHLQDSFHSALHDFREILGAGQVQTGFEVQKEGDQNIKVQPGLAFDFQNNRIVCDQPQTLDVTFEAEEETKYVCIKYTQVEDYVVEGQPTLIWDSCSILLINNSPKIEDNLVPIAILQRSDSQETFEVVTLPAPGETQEPEKPVDVSRVEVPVPAIPAEEEPEDVNGEALLPPDEESEDGIVGDELVEAAPTETLPMEEGIETASEPEKPTTESQYWRWPIKQGIVHMGGNAEGMSLNALLLEPLRRKLGAGGNDVNGSDLLFTLAEESVALDFYPVSLNSQTIIQADLWIIGDPGDDEIQPIQHRVQSTSQGEVTFAEDTISQFGVTTSQYRPSDSQEGLLDWTNEVNEFGIGNLYFGDRFETDRIPEDICDVLRQLNLLVKVEGAEDCGFKVTVRLTWNGGVDEGTIQAIERMQIRFTWKSVIAWKVLGRSSVNSSKMEATEK